MPLSIRKVTVNVSLCGAIPRSRLLSSARPSSTCDNSQEELSLARCAKALRSQLTQMTSSQLNTARPTLKQFVFSGCPVQAHENETLVSTRDRSKIIRTGTQPQLSEIPCTSKSHFSTTVTDMKVQNAGADIGRKHRLAPSPAPIDPPQWAVPARGEAKLEPVCEAYGTHPVVDLTSKSSFRVGRSPTSDVQLWHETSSRRHALLFHHPNGQCYVVDCGSAHGTFINGRRVLTTPKGGMVVPHRIRRGALIRFGGPGAPAYVLKSVSAGMSSKLSDAARSTTDAPINSTTLFNTQLNMLGPPIGSILKSKRNFTVINEEENCRQNKRQRCSSPPPELQEPLRLVSPDNLPKKTMDVFPTMVPNKCNRRVSFSSDLPEAFYPVLVTPHDLSSDDDSFVERTPL